jgi:flagellar motor switch protein FliM
MLSQSEIDALLKGAIEIEEKDGGGSVNLAEIMGTPSASPVQNKFGDQGKKIQAYNFWSPERFSKEQIRAVELVHEDLAERLSSSLPTHIRTSLRPRLVHTEQGRFHDFLKDLPEQSLFHLITLAPLPGQMILTISPNVCHVILEQRLGGKMEGDPVLRTLTDIDQSLLRGLVEHMLNDLKSAWSKVAAIEPQLDDSTVNQHWVQMLMGNERVLLLTFELAINMVTGTMNIYIPFSSLKPLAGSLNPAVWVTGRKEKSNNQASHQLTLDLLYPVKLPVRVTIGKSRLSLGDVANLNIGDVIRVDTSVKSNLVMRVANEDLFNVQIGKVGKNLAVQVVSVHRDDGKLI